MDIAISENLTVKYVCRKVFLSEKLVNLEESIEKALENYRFAFLTGFSGVGKSTSAEYLAKKFAERKIVVKLIPADIHKNFELKRVNYGVIYVYLNKNLLGIEERLKKLVIVIQKVAKSDSRIEKAIKSIFKRFEKLRKAKKELVEKLKVNDKKTTYETLLATEDGIKVVEHVKEFAEDLGFEFEQLKGEDLLEVLNVSFFKENLVEILKYLPYVSTILSIGLFLAGILKLREKDKEVEKIVNELGKVDNVLIIVDDFADFERSREVVLDFLKLCYEVGIRVFVVERMWRLREELMEIVRLDGDGRLWACVNLFREGEAEAKPDTPLWGLSGDNLKECVFVMMNPSFEEFEKIVEANREIIEEERKRKGLGEIGDLREWYRKTLGIPYLALSLMRFKRLEDVKAEGVGTYPLKPFFELSEGEAGNLMKAILNGYAELYRAVVLENKHLIPVILHDMSEDELREFYKRMGWNCNPEDLEYESCIRVYGERWGEKGNEIKVYGLSEMDLKLREAFEVLAEEGYSIGSRRVKDDLIKWNETFLEVITEKFLKFGIGSVRMVLEALRAIFFLERLGHNVDDDCILLWLRGCLRVIPERGIVLAEKGLKVAREGIFALSFLDDLAQMCLFDPRGRELMKRVWERLRDFKTKSEAEKALKITAESNCVRAISYLGLWEEMGLDVFNEFKRLKNECKNLKDEFLRSYVLSWVLRWCAENLRRNYLLESAEEVLKEAEGWLKRARRPNLSEEGKEFFKPFGGDPEVKANGSLDALKSSIRFERGWVLIDLAELDEAVVEFKVSKELWERLNAFVEALKCESLIKRCEVIGEWEFGDKIGYDPFEKALKLWNMLDLETKSCLCCEYALALAINGYGEKELKALEERIAFLPEHLAITIGVLTLLGEERLLKTILKPLRVKAELKQSVLELLQAMDEKIVKERNLEGVVKERMRIVENYDELLKGLKAEELEFGEIKLLEFVRGVYERNEEKAKDVVWLTTIASTLHALIKILWLILSEYKEEAFILALSRAEYCGLLGHKLLQKLFNDLAEALEKNDEKDIKTAIVKLFYYHV